MNHNAKTRRLQLFDTQLQRTYAKSGVRTPCMLEKTSEREWAMTMSSMLPGRRRFARYSLRGMLALILLACVLCAWLQYEVTAARNQRLAVEAILAYGGEVTFHGAAPISQWNEDAQSQLPAPTWWTRLLGEDPRLRVKSVSIYGPRGFGNQPNFDDLIELLTSVTSASPSPGSIREFKSLDLVLGSGQAVHEQGVTHDKEPGKALDPIMEEASGFADTSASKSPSKEIILRLAVKLRGLERLQIRDAAISDADIEYLRGACPGVLIDAGRASQETLGGGLF